MLFGGLIVVLCFFWLCFRFGECNVTSVDPKNVPLFLYYGLYLQLKFLIHFDTGLGSMYGKITGHDLVSGKELVAGKLFPLAVVMIIRNQQIHQ